MTSTRGGPRKSEGERSDAGHINEMLSESKQVFSGAGMESQRIPSHDTEKVQVPGRKEQNIDDTGIKKDFGGSFQEEEKSSFQGQDLGSSGKQ